MTTAQRARLILSLGVLNLVLATIAFGIGGVGLQQRNAASGQPPVAVVNTPSPSAAPTGTEPTGSSSQAPEPAPSVTPPSPIASPSLPIASPSGPLASPSPWTVHEPGVGTARRGAGLHADTHRHAAACHATDLAADGRPDHGAHVRTHLGADGRSDECTDGAADVSRDPEADIGADRSADIGADRSADIGADRSADPTPDAEGDTRTCRSDRKARRRRQGPAALPDEGRPAARSQQDRRPAQVLRQGQGKAQGQGQGQGRRAASS